ncbi:hypothetical protein METEAL_26800 [Mesoterricola silvestris]|uniref:Metallo-beta-lactamase domain-containing protein n=1 Tax=Mesoterricola silvestris TaxID=2927979 RepID=A0AA48K9I0_9BACT|nr:hypothetical protein METEAL_26800 [Mesoterricola silvestris]
MLSRDELWQRLSGDGFWALPWALAGACAVPWVLPEAWDGTLPPGARLGGWAAVALTLPLAVSRRWMGLPLAIALAWGTLGALGRLARWEGALPSGPARVRGVLAEPWTLRGRARAGALRVEAPEALRGLTLPLSLPASGAPPPPPGSPVAFGADLLRVDMGPAFLAARPLWRARDEGAPRRIHLPSALVMEVLGPPRPSPLLAVRARVRARFAALPIPDAARDLWGALTLGIPPAHGETFSPFVQSGTIHTLVVSGLQVSLVMAGLEALWRRALGRGSAGAAMAGGLAYCALVGFTAPVWRGFLMGVAWAAARGTGWKAPQVVTLHGALAAWLLAHPAAGCDPGFLLSWLALTGLLWGSRPLAGLVAPLAGRFAGALARVLAPWLTTLPLLALFHGGAPLWSAAANLVLLPLVAVLAPLCLALVFLPAPWAVAPIGRLLAWVGGTLVPLFARVVPLGTGILWPWAALALGWILLAQLHAGFRRTRWLTAALVAGSLGLMASRGTGAPPRALSIEALDIGQGDALLVRVPGGDATLVDTGPDAWAARRIARVLSRRGVREPVHLLLTHPHQDHAGGWEALEGLWPLATVGRPAMAASRWEPFGAPSSRRRAAQLRRGDAWTRGGAAFSVRWPPGPMALRDVNMNSLVLRVTWRGRELWLMGDALSTQERDLLDLGDPGPPRPGRILKAGHHGSRSASHPAWTAALDPRIALLCAGRDNPFGHPHAEALEALGAAQAWVTGDCLGIRAEAVPEGWLVETGRGLALLLASPTPEDPQALQGGQEVPAHPRVVFPPLPVRVGPHPVGHRQHRAAGHPRLGAGREDPREFQVLHRRQPPQAPRPLLRAGDPRRHGHGMGREGQGRLEGRGPPHGFDVRPVGPPLQLIQANGQGLRGPHRVPRPQAPVIAPAGAHEQHPRRPQLRQEPGRGDAGRQRADARARHPPPLRRRGIPPGKLRGEGGEEEGGMGVHGLPW